MTLRHLNMILAGLLVLAAIGCGRATKTQVAAPVDQQDEVISPAREKKPVKPVPFLYGYGKAEANTLADAKLSAFQKAQNELLHKVLAVADQVAREDGAALGLSDTDEFLLRFHGVVQGVMDDTQVDMETIQEGVSKGPEGNYAYMIDLRLSKSYVMEKVQAAVRDRESSLPMAEEKFLSAFAQTLRLYSQENTREKGKKK